MGEAVVRALEAGRPVPAAALAALCRGLGLTDDDVGFGDWA